MCDGKVIDMHGNLTVEDIIKGYIEQFCDKIDKHEFLEIDTYLEDEDAFKIINYRDESAYQVSVKAIIEQPVKDVIGALETGAYIRLYQITRIVGYYSRVHNWNKSKKQELIQRIESRHNGVGYSLENNFKIEKVKTTINFLNKM